MCFLSFQPVRVTDTPDYDRLSHIHVLTIVKHDLFMYTLNVEAKEKKQATKNTSQDVHCLRVQAGCLHRAITVGTRSLQYLGDGQLPPL